MPMNMLEKIHACLVSERILLWHYPDEKKKPYVYWLRDEKGVGDAEIGGHRFGSLAEMIESAYAHIDPLQKALPQVSGPPSAPHDCPCGAHHA